MSAAVGVWYRTKGTLTDVVTIPDASGVLANIDCWATAKLAVTISSNNNPVFFILPPTPNSSNSAPAISFVRQGLRPKSNKPPGRGQGYEGVWPPAPKVFSGSSVNLMLHLRLHPCNIAPLLKTNGLGFSFYSRAPSSPFAPAEGLPRPECRHGRRHARHRRVHGSR